MDGLCDGHISDSETLLDPSRQRPHYWTESLSGSEAPHEVRNLLYATKRPNSEMLQARLRAWRFPCAAMVMMAVGIFVLIEDIMRRGRAAHRRDNMLAAESSVVLDKVQQHVGPVEIMWHTNPNLCWSVAGDNGHALQLWSCKANPATFLVPSSSRGTIKWAQNPSFCLDWHVNGPRMKNCTQASIDNTQFEFDVAAEGCGTVGVLPEGRQCIGAQTTTGGSGSAVSLLDCTSPMTNSLYFCLPRSAVVQMRAASLLSGPDGQKRKTTNTADSKKVHAGDLLRLQANPEKCVGVAYDQTGTGKGDSLQIWECSECNDHFVLPRDGEPGMIRWAEHPDFCLDSPEDPTDPTVLQLWQCNVTPAEHKNFTLRLGVGMDGTMRQSHKNDSCISLPDGKFDNGVHLIMRNCNSSDPFFRFSLSGATEAQTTSGPTESASETDGADGASIVGKEAQEEVERTANTTVTTWVTLVCLACSVALFFILCCLVCASMR